MKKTWRCGGLNPGPFTCKANALPLSYIPLHIPHYYSYYIHHKDDNLDLKVRVISKFVVD